MTVFIIPFTEGKKALLTAVKPEEHEISFTCTTFAPRTKTKLSGAAGAPVYLRLHWNKEKLKVFFKVKPNREGERKIPTWRIKSAPLQRMVSTSDVLEWANRWRSFGGISIPEFVETLDEDDSDIRVLLTTIGNLALHHLSYE